MTLLLLVPSAIGLWIWSVTLLCVRNLLLSLYLHILRLTLPASSILKCHPLDQRNIPCLLNRKSLMMLQRHRMKCSCKRKKQLWCKSSCDLISNLSGYGILLWFKHADNLTHPWSFLRIWINTSQSSQKGTFKGTCWRPGLNVRVYHLFCTPISNHHLEPVNQIYLQ